MYFLVPFLSFLAFVSCCLASEVRESATFTSLPASFSTTKRSHWKSGESSAASGWPSTSPSHRTWSYHSSRSSRTHTHSSHTHSSHKHSSHTDSSHTHTSVTMSPTSSTFSTWSTSSTTSTISSSSSSSASISSWSSWSSSSSSSGSSWSSSSSPSSSSSSSSPSSSSSSSSPSSSSSSSSPSSSSSSSSPSSSSSTPNHNGGGGVIGTTTYTVSHHHTVVVALGAYVLGGVKGGFAAVKDISGVVAIAAGALDLITTDSDGNIEESTISSPSETSMPTRTKSSTVSSTVSTTTSTTSSTSSSSSSSSSTSSLATGSPSPFVIAPKTGTSKQAQNDFTKKLTQLAAPDTTRTVIGLNNDIALWFADLKPDDADTIEADPIVKEFFPDQWSDSDYEPPVNASSESMYRRDVSNGPSISKGKRDDRFKEQRDADRSLQVISQPSRITPAEAHGYDYLVEAGRDVTIFVLEGGVELSHIEFTDGGLDKGTRETILVTPGDVPGDRTGHGTCVASKAVGFRVGTAKSANLVVVQMKQEYKLIDPNGPANGKREWRSTLGELFAGLNVIKDRVVSAGLQGKAVVNMSHSTRMETKFVRSQRGQSLIREYRRLLQDLADLDVVLVAASGNSRQRRETVDTYPALLGLGDTGVPLIITGAVNWESLRTPYSQGTTEITVSAPGDIICADYKNQDLKDDMGTSYATPAVAGVAAVLLSTQDPQFKVLPPIAVNMRDKIQSLAYPRTYYTNPPPSTLWIPPVVYNGVDNYDAGCSSSGGSKRRRNNETGSDAAWLDERTDSCPPPSYPSGTLLTKDIVQFASGFAWNNCLFDLDPTLGISVTESESDGVWSYVVLCDCYDADYYVHFVLSNGTQIITPLTQGGQDIVQEQDVDNLGVPLVEWFYTGQSH